MMNTLVIYDSEYGNTQQIAQAIAEAFKEHGSVQLIAATEASMPSLQGVDLLVIGGPTQAHGLSPTLHTLLDKLPDQLLHGLPVASFDTRFRMAAVISGSAGRAIAHKLEREKAKLLVPAKSFFVTSREGPLEEGELENAARWVKTIMERYQVYRHQHATT
ncbi:MAG TPA: flavodoxin domain-containing protein [Ktedonobacteraceae bacterium]|nr:flavodoxin domain-containing protein [Ktedonobacteraceae bacterium]